MKKEDFFSRNADVVAQDLVGCRLVVNENVYQITEVEAYLGEKDTASHARFGRTDRSEIMYGSAGVIYVYLIYGIHYMLNIVTGQKGDPQAVLIRGIEGADGPGRLTKKLSITKAKHNGQPLGEESGVWIEDRPADFDSNCIDSAPRVGIDYADLEWKDKELRFILSK